MSERVAARVAMNGFGRIGRAVLRIIVETGSDLDVVAVNDLTDGATLAHLYNFDSVYGRPADRAHVEAGAERGVGETLVVGGRRIRLIAESDPARLPWRDLGVDVVLEATGRFTAAKDARIHLDRGAHQVLVSAPSSGADVTLVRGVNWDAYEPAAHRIVSNGSCTTNALAPLARVLHDLAGIEQGFVTTVHAYTHDQRLVDGAHRDLRRARAAGVNIVPTSTGAAKAIGKVLPDLDGRLAGDAIRVPVIVGSIVDLSGVVSRDVTVDQVNDAFREAATVGPLADVMVYSEDPLVSSDVIGESVSAIFDAGLTRVMGRQVKVSAWYDNEWGFSHRLVDTLEFVTRG